MSYFDQIETFEVTEDHLKLLRRAYVRWDNCEFGAPAIDPKRPYGNSSVIGDIAEILHPEIEEMRDGARQDWLDDNEDRLRQIHDETETVLQIALTTGQFKAGVYERQGYGPWVITEEVDR